MGTMKKYGEGISADLSIDEMLILDNLHTIGKDDSAIVKSIKALNAPLAGLNASDISDADLIELIISNSPQNA